MRHNDIHAGDILRLKKKRQKAYALTDRDLYVLTLVPRRGYVVPWIKCRTGALGEGFFQPQDFERRV